MVDGNLIGSVLFEGEISDIPGMGNTTLSGNIHSNGAFHVSGSADNLSFSGFALDADVAVANYDVLATSDPGNLLPEDLLAVRVYFDGDLTSTLLGASFSAKGDLATNGTGHLTLTLRSNGDSFDYNGLKFEIPEGSSTVELRQELVDGNLTGSVWFEGEISDVASGFVPSLNVSGYIHSSGSFSITGSMSVEAGVKFGEIEVARITGTFSVTITESGFTGSISGAKLQTPGLNGEWVTNFEGSATIDENGNGVFTPLTGTTIEFSPPLP